MAFFGKLFEKKICDFCGSEIKLLGNRKLEDGNMCKACAEKLSPWFSDRRSSTVAEIGQQLEYREANKAKVAAFRTTRTLGENTRVLLDEDAGLFMVTSSRNLQQDNPDVLAFTDLTGCELDIDEDEREIKKTGADGKQESYDPPRYRYYYNFYVQMQVNNPYFDQIRFRLNGAAVEIETPPMPAGPARLKGLVPRVAPERDADYRRYKETGEEICRLMLESRQQARDEQTAAQAPKAAVTCPYCGATTTPDAAGCCEYCGGAVNG